MARKLRYHSGCPQPTSEALLLPIQFPANVHFGRQQSLGSHTLLWQTWVELRYLVSLDLVMVFTGIWGVNQQMKKYLSLSLLLLSCFPPFLTFTEVLSTFLIK